MEKLERAFIQQLQNDYGLLWQDAVNHLESLKRIDIENPAPAWGPGGALARDGMTFATREEMENAHSIRRRLADLGTRLLQAVRASALMDSADEAAIRQKLRGMSSALFLRRFIYKESYVINDEDRFCGIQPAEQSEDFIDATNAASIFNRSAAEIVNLMELIAPSPENLAGAIVSSQTPGVIKSRPSTAFIMMQISEAIPMLEDIKNAVQAVFRSFAIQAVRADDIQHSGIITQRILDEISTSEFLFADLTGARPSVYYEVGFAHAIGKRPILFREKGAALHFDLLVHNVPEYKNATDLSRQLTERLKAVTGREPKS